MKRHFLLLSAALFILSSCGDGSESSKHDDTPGKVGTENSVPCETGDRKLTICADETGGFQNYQCEEGVWKRDGECFHSKCSDGEVKLIACGEEDKGIQKMSCEKGTWKEGGECSLNKVCDENEFRTVKCEDGKMTKAQVCRENTWVDETECAVADKICEEGEKRTVECGNLSDREQQVVCSDGKWTQNGSCEATTCQNGDVKELACGVDYKGIQRKECIDSEWKSEGGCIYNKNMDGQLIPSRIVMKDRFGAPVMIEEVKYQIVGEYIVPKTLKKLLRHNWSGGEWIPLQQQEFDSKGNIVKQIEIKVESEYIPVEVTTEFNDSTYADLFLEVTAENISTGDLKITSWNEQELLDNGKHYREVKRTGEGEIFYSKDQFADENGMVEKSKTYFIDLQEFHEKGGRAFANSGAALVMTNTTDKTTITDMYGNPLLIETYNKEGRQTSYYENYVDMSGETPTVKFIDSRTAYDSKGKVTELVDRNISGEVRIKVSKTYDASGRILVEKCENPLGVDSVDIPCHQTGDKKLDNFIKKWDYDENGNESRFLFTSEVDDQVVTVEERGYKNGKIKLYRTLTSRNYCPIPSGRPWRTEKLTEKCPHIDSVLNNGRVTLEEWTYDEEGRLTAKNGFNSENEKIYTETFAHSFYTDEDNKGKLKETIYTNNFSLADTLSKFNQRQIFEYKYDDGWTEVKKTDLHDKSNFVSCEDKPDDYFRPEECESIFTPPCSDLNKDGKIGDMECGCILDEYECKPGARKDHCTFKIDDGKYVVDECDDTCQDLDWSGAYEEDECGCVKKPTVCTEGPENTCVESGDGVYQVDECPADKCEDKDNNGIIDPATECIDLSTATPSPIYRYGFRKTFEGSSLKKLELKFFEGLVKKKVGWSTKWVYSELNERYEAEYDDEGMLTIFRELTMEEGKKIVERELLENKLTILDKEDMALYNIMKGTNPTKNATHFAADGVSILEQYTKHDDGTMKSLICQNGGCSEDSAIFPVELKLKSYALANGELFEKRVDSWVSTDNRITHSVKVANGDKDPALVEEEVFAIVNVVAPFGTIPVKTIFRSVKNYKNCAVTPELYDETTKTWKTYDATYAIETYSYDSDKLEVPYNKMWNITSMEKKVKFLSGDKEVEKVLEKIEINGEGQPVSHVCEFKNCNNPSKINDNYENTPECKKSNEEGTSEEKASPCNYIKETWKYDENKQMVDYTKVDMTGKEWSAEEYTFTKFQTELKATRFEKRIEGKVVAKAELNMKGQPVLIFMDTTDGSNKWDVEDETKVYYTHQTFEYDENDQLLKEYTFDRAGNKTLLHTYLNTYIESNNEKLIKNSVKQNRNGETVSAKTYFYEPVQ